MYMDYIYLYIIIYKIENIMQPIYIYIHSNLGV